MKETKFVGYKVLTRGGGGGLQKLCVTDKFMPDINMKSQQPNVNTHHSGYG